MRYENPGESNIGAWLAQPVGVKLWDNIYGIYIYIYLYGISMVCSLANNVA
eukprot:NODE_325_length_1480_cov_149.215234_g236_i0.p9 GENE.NODE_325_length_1480_cov_149.215234_g236_i0~~NODE_325_length_1480_cov_149.215234_g236_i0.p9  ORF type:complete len:51 (+),score=0.39 NODE_325_length_1480_cov_149.215234_g236_i0:223-375(+)